MNSFSKKITSGAMAIMIFSAGINCAFASDNNTEISFDNQNYTNYGATITEGTKGNALMLSGTEQYAEFDASKINTIQGDFTISVFCKPDSSKTWARIYDIGTGEDSYIFLTISSGSHTGIPRFAIKTKTGGEQTLDASTGLDIGEWNNITVTRQGSTTTIYINGIESGKTENITYNFSDLGKTTNNYIGKSQFKSDPYFAGAIDELTFSSAAITSDDVKTLAKDSYERQIRKQQEAERKAHEKLISDNNRLIIDTDFYDAQTGEKIQQINANTSVKAEINVKNLKKGDAQIKYTANGEESIATIPEGESDTYTVTFDDADNIFATVTDGDKVYDAGRIYKSDTEFPKYSPADSADTTEGVHDPTIFHDPVGGKYWVYSTHNQVFESEDLINWSKHDYTQIITVPEKSREFIEKNYTDTQVNETYWAPDILYVPEDKEHPYWFYLSISCGLGGRNSVIDLVKSDSPGLWDGKYEDCGVVLASVENREYNTNAIDANIYTDTDGKRYFIWGSFWRGIHAAELNDDGTVKGIDYKNDQTILESSKQFGKRLFSTPGGVSGPEGPFMVNNIDTGYRYMFTSYGWLGTNYNIRIARAPLSQSMESIINGENPHHQFRDAQDRMVGTTYADQSDKSELWGYKMIGSYQLCGGQTFYGNGHCSVMQDNDGNWYYVEHARKVPDAVAYLQVHKMLWTEDGWPVVSPMVYAGEQIQDIPETLIYGTWDLSSVGHTIMKKGVHDVSKCASSDTDLPVGSSEITLMPNGKIAGNKGTWQFDGKHTVTLTFTQNGDEDLNEYYSSGDVMELYVMTGFDKEAQEQTVIMTGLDQNHIAQFMQKCGQCADDTYSNQLETISVNFNKSTGGNPVLGFDENGDILYGGDPSALVVGDTVYIYVGHDTSTGSSYVMPDWRCYSSKNMKDWEYEGVIMSAADIPWASGSTSAWAGQVEEHNGKYYFYYCTWAKKDVANDYQCIGVAVSDSPTGPFVDIGQPLINGETDTTENTSTWNDIDPTVLKDTDENGVEHIYLAWGNGVYYVCELNDDMVSVKEGTLKTQTIEGMGEHVYTEAPWLYNRDGKYYTFFASDWREQMAYASTDDITSGVWNFGKIIMPPTATSNTNHPAVIDFNGDTYFIYHNGSLPYGSGFRRVVNIAKISWEDNGGIAVIPEYSTGLGGTAYTIESFDEKVFYGYENSENTLLDDDYPMTKEIIGIKSESNGESANWEIVGGLFDKENDSYVSIQALDKPGLYIAVNDDNEAVVTQDADGAIAKKMTFKTVFGLAGNGISIESVAKPGKFLTWNGEKMLLTDGSDKKASTFIINQMFTVNDVLINSVEGNNVNIKSNEKELNIWAAKYDENGTLTNVNIVNTHKTGEFTVDIGFEPDKIKVYNAGGKLLSYK